MRNEPDAEVAREEARARRYYDRFAARYEERRDGRGRYHDLVDALEVELASTYVDGREVLEVGCGTGLVLRALAPRSARAVGVDLSPGMLACARARGLDVVEGSALALPFAEASFDVAVSFKTLPHVPDLARALAEMARVVRPGGVLIVETYNPNSLRRWVKRWGPKGVVASSGDAVSMAYAGHDDRRPLREDEVFTRFDDRAAVERALPSFCRIERARGIRVAVPIAAVLDLPFVGGLATHFERAIADHPLAARFGGLVAYVVRRG